ncbi:MAG: hypothetical protein O2944_10835 [Proteobacteria bacterium]|nr:hypothetical protein [Pseudomonadota bacterium]
MSNPFVLAMRNNPGQFLTELETAELRAIAEACVGQLAARAKTGDKSAPNALQALYRAVANIEI